MYSTTINFFECLGAMYDAINAGIHLSEHYCRN